MANRYCVTDPSTGVRDEIWAGTLRRTCSSISILAIQPLPTVTLLSLARYIPRLRPHEPSGAVSFPAGSSTLRNSADRNEFAVNGNELPYQGRRREHVDQRFARISGETVDKISFRRGIRLRDTGPSIYENGASVARSDRTRDAADRSENRRQSKLLLVITIHGSVRRISETTR